MPYSLPTASWPRPPKSKRLSNPFAFEALRPAQERAWLARWEPVLNQIQAALAGIPTVAAFNPKQIQLVTALPILFTARRGTAADLAQILQSLLRGWDLPARRNALASAARCN